MDNSLCMQTKTLRQKHKDYIHNALHGNAKFTWKQATKHLGYGLEKQNKTEQQNKTWVCFAQTPILCWHLNGGRFFKSDVWISNTAR